MNKRQLRIGLLALIVVAFAAVGGYMLNATAQNRPYNSQTEGELPANQVASAPSATAAPAAAPSAAGMRVVVAESFDNLTTNNWKPLDHTDFADQKGGWASDAGKLAAKPSENESFEDSMLLTPTDVAGRAEVSVLVYPQGNQVVGLVFRNSDKGYYLFRVFRDASKGTPHRQLQRYNGQTGGYTVIAEDKQGKGYDLDRWQDLSVILDGDHIICFFDGKQVFDVRDGTLASGTSGVYALSLGEVLFDNFTIKKP